MFIIIVRTLLYCLLRKEPLERPSAEDLLHIPWIFNNSAMAENIEQRSSLGIYIYIF